MNKIAIAAAVAAALASTAGVASAQTTPAPAAPAVPSLGAVIAATPGLSISGYMAGSYTYFDTSSTLLRAYDNKTNGFSANQASATVAYLPSSGFGAQVNVIAGNDAKVLNGNDSAFYLNNAFVQYANGGLTILGGKFSSLAGYESTNPVNDSTVSRSILFWDMEPGALTGLRASYAVSPALTVIGGVNNGWVSPQPSNTAKTIELGLTGSPSSLFSYTADYYRGQSPLFGGSTNGVLQLFDFVGSFNVNSALTLAANVDLLSKDDALPGGGAGKANGLALYATYALSDQFSLAARGEYIDDKDGIVSGSNGTSNKLKELTLAVNYTPVKNFKLSAEVRQDKSDNAIFTDKDGSPTTKQNSVELMAVYSF
ncbi:MAG: outer membrane beta-barrel protein [Thiomonas sp.]|uniref:outer membrane beta-barrel protein n=1 Tax=Thiomonas sp. TaxID=2047785 RepID=UPI002A370294|nr:outer membrane beta-barrel protein [Thiomonas sp.]MDY0331315.1 outer membrane beta-barrel protein [Thiomonas sp.]